MTRNILNVPTGDTFCRIFLHRLVNAPVNVVKTLEIVLCSSPDGVPLGLEKDTIKVDPLIPLRKGKRKWPRIAGLIRIIVNAIVSCSTFC